MLALDPPLGAGDAATVGGVVATGDSGPLRHRYGGVRDLIVGISLALSDGTLAKAGGKVIKNVAGYDLAKLFTGSHGTLGLIVTRDRAPASQARSGPRPRWARPTTPSAVAGRDPAGAACRSRPTRSTPPGRTAPGRLLARFGGATAGDQAEATAKRMRDAGLDGVQTVEDDEDLWAALRAAQRSARRAGRAARR